MLEFCIVEDEANDNTYYAYIYIYTFNNICTVHMGKKKKKKNKIENMCTHT